MPPAQTGEAGPGAYALRDPQVCCRARARGEGATLIPDTRARWSGRITVPCRLGIAPWTIRLPQRWGEGDTPIPGAGVPGSRLDRPPVLSPGRACPRDRSSSCWGEGATLNLGTGEVGPEEAGAVVRSGPRLGGGGNPNPWRRAR